MARAGRTAIGRALSVVVEQQILVGHMHGCLAGAHLTPPRTVRAPSRILRTARKMQCLVALVFKPSAAPMSLMDMPFDVAQRERRALNGRQAQHRLTNPRFDLSGEHEAFRCRLRRKHVVRPPGLIQIEGIVSGLAPSRGPEVIDRAVYGNAGQPGPDVRTGLESNQLGMRLQPGVLDDVPRVLGIASDPKHDAKEVAAVTLHQRPKGLDVAIPGSGDGRQVALVHAYGLDDGGDKRLGSVPGSGSWFV